MNGMLACLVVELSAIALVTLGVGTFAPPLDRWFPWGRAFRRWRNRRLAAGIRALERKGAPDPVTEARVRVAGYRDNAAPSAPPSPVAERSSVLARYRARREASFVARLEADAESAEDSELSEAPERNARV